MRGEAFDNLTVHLWNTRRNGAIGSLIAVDPGDVDFALKGDEPAIPCHYVEHGRNLIPPERLLRALLVQLLYSVRNERMLMEQMEYDLLFHWFVGLSANEAVWHDTVFTKNCNRLLEGAVAEEFFSLIVEQARAKRLLPD